MELEVLRNRHLGEDIYVLGSGASMDFIEPAFYDGKTIVATNLVGHLLGIYRPHGNRIQPWVYTHSHYHVNALEVATAHPEAIVVAPSGDRGFSGTPETLLPNVIYYDHVGTGAEFDVDAAWHDTGLIVGSSGIHGSMHLAAYMGAANIILVGADCGLIDGRSNHGKYVDEYGRTSSGDLLTSDALMWLGRWDRHLREVKRKIQEVYGCGVYSLNPFVNFNLEGHSFTSGVN
jgi:hypothetical protein